MVLNSIPVCVMEPTYPINLGYIARVMKNFGLSELFIINPQVKLSDAYPFASHGRDLIDSAVILRSLNLSSPFRFEDLLDSIYDRSHL